MINPQKLTSELVQAGLPCVGASTGESGGDEFSLFLGGCRLDFSRALNKDEKKTASKTVKAHDPRDIDEERRRAYCEAGATIEALSVALWEKTVEGRPEEADKLQVIRERIKADIPK